MGSIALVYHHNYKLHETGNHPERKERLSAIIEVLKKLNAWEKLEHITPEIVDMEILKMVHSERHIAGVRDFALKGGGWWDPDTYVSPNSFEVALLAAGGAVRAVTEVMEGRSRVALALVRPPGHHAEPQRAMGFCLFNNIAVAAKYAQAFYKLDRIMIVDWDAHHGNGTQAAFISDPSVLYFSVHQSPLFPGTGAAGEMGTGTGKGYTVNIPLPAGTGDRSYYYLFQKIFMPLAVQYRPQLILVSAGFDAHFNEYLAGLSLTSEGFARIAAVVKDIADKYCGGRIVLALEGGYSLDTVGYPLAAVVNVLGNLNLGDIKDPLEYGGKDFIAAAQEKIEASRKLLCKYWEL